MKREKQLIYSDRMKKLDQVENLLGRTSLSENEKWIFDNYWDSTECDFCQDDRGELDIYEL